LANLTQLLRQRNDPQRKNQGRFSLAHRKSGERTQPESILALREFIEMTISDNLSIIQPFTIA